MIEWPIYEIRNHKKLWEDNKVLYIKTDFNIEYVIDNKNLKGDTLGKRRLRLTNIDDVKIYKLKEICYTWYEVFNAKSKIFIDSSGILLTLEKKKTRQLIYRRVLNHKIINNKMYCKCDGIYRVIEIPFIPKVTPKYLGLLTMYGDHELYELSHQWKKDTWRKW